MRVEGITFVRSFVKVNQQTHSTRVNVQWINGKTKHSNSRKIDKRFKALGQGKTVVVKSGTRLEKKNLRKNKEKKASQKVVKWTKYLSVVTGKNHLRDKRLFWRSLTPKSRSIRNKEQTNLKKNTNRKIWKETTGKKHWISLNFECTIKFEIIKRN